MGMAKLYYTQEHKTHTDQLRPYDTMEHQMTLLAAATCTRDKLADTEFLQN